MVKNSLTRVTVESPSLGNFKNSLHEQLLGVMWILLIPEDILEELLRSLLILFFYDCMA